MTEAVEGGRRYPVADDLKGSGQYVNMKRMAGEGDAMERADMWENLLEGTTPMMTI